MDQDNALIVNDYDCQWLKTTHYDLRNQRIKLP
ncbi:hypothetical protein MTCD1_01870 [Colwellia marinimaniae]|uniref:Uncharacterized protein n=1 Tax=Colwellia marinimaniae TaxID=1513592 RepID=A0ABQ0MV61_9GAMM|nr:hypothetical protein MTCD1_01870 [Colwellia marinimaniae]